MVSSRDLHQHILDRLKLALGGRPWSWLSDAAHVPESTLATQRLKPKFSVDVLVSVAEALDRPITYFLPDGIAKSSTSPEEVLAEIESILSRRSDGN